MDALYIEKICRETNELFRKKRITGISYTEKEFKISIEETTLTFILKNPNGIILKEKKITTGNFFKKFKGTYIKNIYTIDKDRVINFEIIKITLSGKKEIFHIIIELTGKNANVFLTTENGKIIFKAREAYTEARETEIGKIYEPPPNRKRDFKEIRFGKIKTEGIEKNLYKYVKGLSPLNSKEIAYYVKNKLSLKDAYKKFMENHNNSDFPYIYYKNGKPKYLTTFKYESIENPEHKISESKAPFTRGWSIFTETIHRYNLVENLRRKLLKEISEKLKVNTNRFKESDEPENLKKEAENLKIQGELLKYNLNKVKSGQKKIKIKDFTTNRAIEIEIDPSKTPKENMNRMFNLSKKLIRKSEYTKKQRENLKLKIDFLSALKEIVETSENLETLREVEKEIFKTNKRDKKKSKKKKFSKYKSPTGKTIIVGKNSIENEILSLKLSNPWDLWFHTKELPGSHVILKLKKDEIPSKEDIEIAASIAAYFSKGKKSGKVKVDYTKVKNLKKPPKTPTGFVIYSGEKTILINPELFSKKINDLKLSKE